MTDHQYNPGWPGYDLRADVALKECGNAIFDLLREQSALPPHEAHAFAAATCRAAFGVLPIGDGLNAVSDEKVRALMPVVEAARASLVILAAVLAQRI